MAVVSKHIFSLRPEGPPRAFKSWTEVVCRLGAPFLKQEKLSPGRP